MDWSAIFMSAQFGAIALASLVAYLLGSISTSIIVSRIFGSCDIRKHGSGNAGATNTLRVVGKKAAIIVVLGDALKGVLAVLASRYIAQLLKADDICQYAAAVFVVVGHVFPLYFGFKGGKGIMTAIAVVFMLSAEIAWILIAVFAAVLICFNYVSLASVIAAIAFPGFVYWIESGNIEFFVCAIIIAVIAVLKHRTNIVRLFKGSESKLIKKRNKE